MVKRSFGYDPAITFGKGAKYMLVFTGSMTFSGTFDLPYLWGCLLGAMITSLMNWIKNQDKISYVQIKRFLKEYL